MSDEAKSTRDLTWLPKLSAEQWQRELDTLCALRLMLAGIGLRHAMDRDTGKINEGLGADIAASQAALQQAIDTVSEIVGALRDLAKVVDDAQSLTGPKAEVLH